MDDFLKKHRDKLKYEVELGKAYSNLKRNSDFKLLIETLYLKDYPLMCLAQSVKPSNGLVDNIKYAQATVLLADWLDSIESTANSAEIELSNIDRMDNEELA